MLIIKFFKNIEGLNDYLTLIECGLIDHMTINIRTADFIDGLRLAGLVAIIMSLCACFQRSQDEGYLVRVGSDIITVAEFKSRVEISSEEAFPGEQTISPSSMNHLRIRVLNQMTDELIIMQRGKQLGVIVTDDELEASIAEVKADYPDDTFEKTLLENAVSFESWKKKMATRLLVDKVIAIELVDKVEITSKDVADYFRKHFPGGVPEGEDADQVNKRTVQHLRQQKAEEIYQNWIDSLRKNFPVEVHQQRWNRLVEANV
jgi:hypothetical protein